MQAGTIRKFTLLLGVATIFAFIGGCKKQVATAPPTQAPPAPTAQPTATLSASPAQINSGDTTTLSWTSTDATDADIEPGVGKVLRSTMLAGSQSFERMIALVHWK